jgi:RND family efflux transporter MFP subunit
VSIPTNSGGARPRGGALLVTLVAVVALAGLAGCGGSDEPAEYHPKEVRADLVDAVRTQIPRTVMATGELEAENAMEVSTRLMGHVREVMVQVGEKVETGQVLVQIDDTDMLARKRQAEAAIDEAEAVLANAETNLARFQRLYAEDSVSKSQLDEVRTGRDRARAGLARAEAALAEVEVQLEYLRIEAPAPGTVTRRLVDPGDMANPGQPLLMLEQTGTMKVRAGLSEKDVDLVAAGEEITVRITSLTQATYTVPIARIVPAANPMSRTFDLEAYLPNERGRLKTGMFARVEVPVGTREAILVPRDAVHERGQLTGVWVVGEDGIAHLRWIRVGQTIGEEIEVISGLEGGERVVLRADLPLVEGDKVVS